MTIKFDNLPQREVIPGYHGRFGHFANMSFVYWKIFANAPLPEHSHPHEQVAQVIEGRFEITIDGRTQVLEPGSLCQIPSNAVHSGRALTDCVILDFFSPIREDYLRYELKP